MVLLRSLVSLLSFGYFQLAAAQFPSTPQNVTILNSKFGDGVYISYKEPGLCETTPGVRSYAGYVHLPNGTLGDFNGEQNYPINTFFWFFEARKDPHEAPLAIWMNGGPGSSSLLGMLAENGPCFVNHDSNSTYLNEWSWNNEVNMLYLDQPVQVGLSYDSLANITYDLSTGTTRLLNTTDPVPQQNNTFLVGTYPSQGVNSTTVGTISSARALWHFAQAWFQEFPAYSPNNSKISIATESYGGRYGPAYAAFFEEQNQKIENGSWNETGDMHILHLDTLMIVNGCIDRQTQWPSYPQIAYNNTYGIKTINESLFNYMTDSYYKPGGCRDQINNCSALASQYDPENLGTNATVNKVCSAAETYCSTNIRDIYTQNSGRNYYDLATIDPSPFPPPWYQGYLNQPHVQAALGVPLNWTQSSSVVASAFRRIGDYPRPGWLQDLAYLLDNEIKVSLVYGDRDFACNWIGGEAVSLAINHTNANAFRNSGYAQIVTNSSYMGGAVRQYGNLSFSRVYQAGHEVPAYQPETAYRIFMRALFDQDIATGQIDTATNRTYSSSGPENAFAFTNVPPAQPLQVCYVLDTSTCSDEVYEAVDNGTALVRDWIVVNQNSTQVYPDIGS